MNNKIILSTLAVIILAVGGWYWWLSNQQVVQAPETSNKTTSAPLMTGKNAIYVGEQLPSKNITVSLASLEKPGFVVIHESKNGKPGGIIGKSNLLSAGENKNILVDLSRVSRDGEVLFAMIHLDDGDGVFEASKDIPAAGTQGSSIMMEFMIKNDASVTGEIKL